MNAQHAQAIDKVRSTWFRMLEENVVNTRPESSAMIEDDTKCTPLGLLTILADEIGPWGKLPNVREMEFPPHQVATAVGLRSYRTTRGEAVGMDIDWINALTDHGVDDRTIGRIVRDVLRQRQEAHGVKETV